MNIKPTFDEKNDQLRISWLVQGVENNNPSNAHSELASNRYRAILPAQAIEDLGHQVNFIAHMQGRWVTTPRPDVLMIGKLLPTNDSLQADGFQSMAEHVLTQIKKAQTEGIVVIADFNDDYFHHPVKGSYWCDLAQTVDCCIASTEPMAELLQKFTNKPIHVIGDPIAAPLYPAKVFQKKKNIQQKILRWMGSDPENCLKLVWYGNIVNWPAMEQWINILSDFKKEQLWLLHVITKPHPKILDFIEKFNIKNGHQFFIKFEEWSESGQWKLVKDSDIVLIPSDVNDRAKKVKTSNRLTDALYAGRYVVASPLPAYLPYSKVASLTDNPKYAIEAYLQSPEACLKKIQQGQKMVLERLNSTEIAGLWIDAIATSLDMKFKEQSPIDLTNTSNQELKKLNQIRLNLGCGDKVMEGYINVDVVPSRLGKAPDILSDLKDLSVFTDNYADEILAVHVVEHFWRWEVEDTLREWVRVLKPGGQMILECPNLVSACEEFLRDPEKHATAGPEGQRTMWVFYGDPAWKDPYMIHRWGYTPSSLSQLMQKVGLINVRQEAAQFKLREPRDMRIVGEKNL